MVWVSADTKMKAFFACDLDQVSVDCRSAIALYTMCLSCHVCPAVVMKVNSLVGTNTRSFQSLGAQLFVLVGDKVDAERELVDVCLLPAEIEDADLGVRYTTVESRLWVGLDCSCQLDVLLGAFTVAFAWPQAQRKNPLKQKEGASCRDRRLESVEWKHAPCSCSIGNISQDDAPSWEISESCEVGYGCEMV